MLGLIEFLRHVLRGEYNVWEGRSSTKILVENHKLPRLEPSADFKGKRSLVVCGSLHFFSLVQFGLHRLLFFSSSHEFSLDTQKNKKKRRFYG